MIALLACALAAAQATDLPLQAPMIVAPTEANTIHVGTPVQLETRQELSTETKGLRVGQNIELTVQQPVLVNNQVAIPAGSLASAEVTSIRNKGMWGKSGGITARFLFLEANGRKIRLNGSFNGRGETGTAGVIASVALLPVAGFFVTGTSARIAPGTRVTAFIAEEVPVQFAGAAAANKPMLVTGANATTSLGLAPNLQQGTKRP